MKRVCLLDDIRGMTLFSMILYHTVWDLELVLHKICLYLAAEYLLDVYFSVGILLVIGKTQTTPGTYRGWRGSIGFPCYRDSNAQSENSLRRIDADRYKHVTNNNNGENIKESAGAHWICL